MRVILDISKYPARPIRFLDSNTNPLSTNPEKFTGPREENPLVLCPESVLVHSLSDNQWYMVAMSRLQKPVWDSQAWAKNLIRPQDSDVEKSMQRIETLAEAHQKARAGNDHNSKNNFKGKGRGLTFLIHGPPGVGKTMLAECLSEHQQRPLYRINPGQLVTGDKDWESKIEDVFRQAHEWNAILLVDEAEVILAERTQENMQQSAWVAGEFLDTMHLQSCHAYPSHSIPEEN